MSRIQKKQNLEFKFTVEGNTEKWYLDWLQNEINSHPKAEYKVNIEDKIEKNPLKFAKATTKLTTPEIAHICDIESNNQEHEKNFKNVLKNLNEAKKQKGLDYKLGYSNFTFELWMILHKTEFKKSLTDRKQYLDFVNSAFDQNYESLNDFKKEINFKCCLKQLTIDNVIDAIKRSEKIEKDNKEKGWKPIKKYNFSYYKENPSLSIHKLIKNILTQCGIIE